VPSRPLRSGLGSSFRKRSGRTGKAGRAACRFPPMLKERNNAMLAPRFRSVRHSDGAYWRSGLLVFRAPCPAVAPQSDRVKQAVGIDFQLTAPLTDHDRRAQILGQRVPVVPAGGNAVRRRRGSAAEAKPPGRLVTAVSRLNHERHQTQTRTPPSTDATAVTRNLKLSRYAAPRARTHLSFSTGSMPRTAPPRAGKLNCRNALHTLQERARLTVSRDKQRGAFKV
jgi:hypothetical protein